MEYLWKKNENKINSNKDKIKDLEKEIPKVYLKAVLNSFSNNEESFSDNLYNLKKSISDLNFKNYLLNENPYNEWAGSMRDSEIVYKYIFVSRFVEKLNSEQPSRDLTKVINEYISRQNALNDEILRRTFVGWETVQLSDPPVEGAINFIKAMRHNYRYPFSKLKN